MPASYLGRRRSRPVADAPALDGAELAKAWLVELVAAAPLERAARLPGPRFADDAPRLCAAVVAALSSDPALDDLEPGGALAPLAAGAGHLAGAPDPLSAIGALDALRAVTWAAVLDAADRPAPGQIAELADRLGAVIATITSATIDAQHPLGPARPGDRGGPLAAVLRDARDAPASTSPTGEAGSPPHHPPPVVEDVAGEQDAAFPRPDEAPTGEPGASRPVAATAEGPAAADFRRPDEASPEEGDVARPVAASAGEPATADFRRQDGASPEEGDVARPVEGAAEEPTAHFPRAAEGAAREPTAGTSPPRREQQVRPPSHPAGERPTRWPAADAPAASVEDVAERDFSRRPSGEPGAPPRPQADDRGWGSRHTPAAEALAQIEATLRDAAHAADPLAEAAARLRALAQTSDVLSGADPFDAAATRLRSTAPPPAEPVIRRLPAVEDASEPAVPVPAWSASIEKRLARHRADGGPFAVLCLEVVDAERLLAADAADEVERVEAAVLAQLRPADALIRERPGRYWLTTPDTDTADARSLGHRIASAVAALPPVRGVPLQVAAGLASCPDDGTDALELEGSAEERLFTARAAGLRVVAGPAS